MAAAQIRMVRRRPRWPLYALLAVSVAGMAWYAMSIRQAAGHMDGTPRAPESMSTWMKAGVGEGAISVPVFKTGLEDLPRSLQGTEVPGEGLLDAQGQLIVSRSLRDLFDYFLSSRGEQADAVLDARIRAYLRHKLPAAAADQALVLLDAYLNYLQKVDGTIQQAQAGRPLSPVERLSTLQRLRRESMSPQAVAAFFGDEEQYDQYTVDKIVVLEDTALTPIQKSQKLKTLRESLPKSLRVNLDAAEVSQSLTAVTDDWRQRGGSVAELRALRENIVGAEAAQRLEALDRDNAQWDARVQAYLQARASILADAALSQAMKQQKIEAMLQAGFNGTEQLRVQAYERMSDAQASHAGS